MVPDEIQQEMKNLYCALCELLRHFWVCFPTTTKALEDKVSPVTLCKDILYGLMLLARFPPQGRGHSPLRNGLGVTAAAACYGTYAREISLLVLLLPWGQQE